MERFRGALRKKYGIIWESFPNMEGRASSIPNTFMNLPSNPYSQMSENRQKVKKIVNTKNAP